MEQIGVPTVKVMAEGGQGFFKICITILPENYSLDLDKGLENTELIQEEGEGNDQVEIKSQRSLHVNGGSIGKKGKLTSVNRLIMLCIVPQVFFVVVYFSLPANFPVRHRSVDIPTSKSKEARDCPHGY
ncbi:unnamed protein product [Brassicogethes aeneus]|uniref:Uncharacterized protein n=1 Tax=Brassicogethes aeneus TaxID=1431903 RepID=A0A9P0BCX7_BRAAE|nr:unnamed protein product [Brassicogethes aeneus]